jgi:hypothetical protein
MYGLVHGREAIPFRKAAPVKPPTEPADEDETLGLGGGWLKWVLPVAGVLLVVALGLAIYQVIPARNDTRTAANRRTGEPEVEPIKEKEQEKDRSQHVDNGDKDKAKGKVEHKSAEENSNIAQKEKSSEKETNVVERTTAPLKDRVAAGNYVGAASTDEPSILVAKKAEGEGWKRVTRGNLVYTSDTLVALPGYTAVVGNSSRGVTLSLRGHVREFTLYAKQQYLGESAVVLHKNDKFDLDLTLLRGRVYLRNNKDKGEAKVRLRFQSEVWDLTLESKGTEVGVDLFQAYSPDLDGRADEEPDAEVLLCLFQGEMELKVDPYKSYNKEADPPKEVLVQWSSRYKVQEPRLLDKAPYYWDKVSPSREVVAQSRRDEIRDMNTALKSLELLSRDKTIDVALRESLEKSEIASRKLAIYCLGAIDDLGKLIEVLGDENPEHWIDRDAATWTLLRWVSRRAGQGKRIYDPKTGTGVLTSMKFRKSEAETIFEMLYDFNFADWNKADTFEALSRYLAHRRVAIAQLAFARLVQMARGAKLPPFNAASPQDDRERYAKQIDEMISKKQLPPPPMAPTPKESPKSDKR